MEFDKTATNLENSGWTIIDSSIQYTGISEEHGRPSVFFVAYKPVTDELKADQENLRVIDHK